MYRDLLIERWNPDIDEYGDAYWVDNMKEINRGGDQPAIVGASGILEWMKDGKTHRNGDKPAVTENDGSMRWYKNGVIHRGGDKPSVAEINSAARSNLRLMWHKNGKTYLPSQEIRDYWDKYYQEYFEDLKKETQDV